jgi:hypothetical protein
MTPLEIDKKLAGLTAKLEMREDEIRALRNDYENLKKHNKLLITALFASQKKELDFEAEQIGTL